MRKTISPANASKPVTVGSGKCVFEPFSSFKVVRLTAGVAGSWQRVEAKSVGSVKQMSCYGVDVSFERLTCYF